MDVDDPDVVQDFLTAALMARNRYTPAKTSHQPSQRKYSNQHPPFDPSPNVISILPRGETPSATFHNQPTPVQRLGHTQPDSSPSGTLHSHHDSRTKLYAPDLTIYREPRPNKKWQGSIRNPDSITSPLGSWHDGDEGVPASRHPPITWKPTIPAAGNTSPTWDGTEYPDLDDGSYVQEVICGWRTKVPPMAPSTFLQETPNHYLSDVHTEHGCLLQPIEYPHTLPRVVDIKDGLEFRRQNWSSAFMERRRLALEEQKERRNGSSIHHLAEVPEKQESGWDRPKEPEPERFKRQILKRKDDSPPPHNLLSPRLPCYLRPARESDMEQIAEIYNWEVNKGIQARDSKPVAAEVFLDVFRQAEQLGMPFLVAVYGSARQPGRRRQENDVLTCCIRDPASTATPDPKLFGKVLGFSYLSVWRPGVTGDLDGSSRATSQVNLFVHPQYKRKRLGTSLLDKIMSTIASAFFSTDAYDFVDPSLNPMYKPGSSGLGPRRFHKVYASFLVRTKVAEPRDAKKQKEEEHYEDDLRWVGEWLTGQFRFENKTRFDMVHRTPRSRPGPVQWLDEVVFEYGCLQGFDPLGEEGY
ncbi:hypothetical protein QBC39DRAFT_83497 [Podospora conica]|nr:hypothetical protein QBC39DRAFT_83497 [Schizothecium conicum]